MKISTPVLHRVCCDESRPAWPKYYVTTSAGTRWDVAGQLLSLQFLCVFTRIVHLLFHAFIMWNPNGVRQRCRQRRGQQKTPEDAG